MPIRVIAGLGNPGTAYVGTRHNVGFQKVDALAQRAGGSWRSEPRLESLTANTSINRQNILLVKPQTFMNQSGRALSALVRYYKIPPSKLLVIYDDVDLSVGEMKLKIGAGSGGHNGIKSLITYLGDTFIRLKIGIGPKPALLPDLTTFVLGRLNVVENETLAARHKKFLEYIDLLIDKGPLIAMNSINRRSRDPQPPSEEDEAQNL